MKINAILHQNQTYTTWIHNNNLHNEDSYLVPFRGRHSGYTPSAAVPVGPPQTRQCWCNSPSNTSVRQFTLLYQKQTRQCWCNSPTTPVSDNLLCYTKHRRVNVGVTHLQHQCQTIYFVIPNTDTSMFV